MPIGTEQVVQHSTAVERIQESLQQQMDLRQKALQNQREKIEERKRKSVEQAQAGDQITIHAEREDRDGGRGDPEARPGDDAPPEDAERREERAAPPAGHVDVTV